MPIHYNRRELTGHKYPECAYLQNQITYFTPDTPNFPAVDLIIRVWGTVIAIQIHIGDHEDVSTKLMKRAGKGKWTRQVFEKIIPVYLSPMLKTRDDLKAKFDRRTTPSQGDRVITPFHSIDQFTSLCNMAWDEPPSSRA